jgi:hypothetical protein
MGITDSREIPPEDMVPSEFPSNCDWARPSILAVVWAFYRSPYFMVRLHSFSANPRSRVVFLEIRFDFDAVNRGTKHRTSALEIELSPKHLCMTVKSTEVPFSAKKRWMHGHIHRPKWKKFGTWACKGLLLRQVHEEVFEVMES